MSLDEYLKLAQIGFYVTAGSVAVLTYIKAKNGLLNAVNTEYKKRVMDRLAEVSRELLAEYDPESPKHWSKVDSVREVLARLHENVVPHKEEILQSGKMWPGIPISSKEQELYRSVAVLRSDPFILRHIRDRLVDFFENRANVMTQVYCEAIRTYAEGLGKGKYWDTLEENHGWLHNQILAELRKRGCGIEQLEVEVHGLRNSIQDYLESFDPIRRKS